MNIKKVERKNMQELNGWKIIGKKIMTRI